MSSNSEPRRRRPPADSPEPLWDNQAADDPPSSWSDRVCVVHQQLELPDSHPSSPSSPCTTPSCLPYTPKYVTRQRGHGSFTPEERPEEIKCKTTISAENQVEAQKLANNYRFGFKKWKSHVTARRFEDRSEVVKELYSELNVVKPHPGSLLTCGNVGYVLLFGWWVSLVYLTVGILLTLTVMGFPHGKFCWRLARYFLWPFGKSIEKISSPESRYGRNEVLETEEGKETAAPLMPTSAEDPNPELPSPPNHPQLWRRMSMCTWLLLGYPVLAVTHCVLCLLSWLLVFTIPVTKMSARTVHSVLLMPPSHVHISPVKETQEGERRVVLCCYHAFNGYYYKYTVDGINVFAVNLLPLVIVALVIGYVDKQNRFVSSEVKFATAIGSIIPLSYYIGMGIASVSAQSNFAVGAVVNATFGSIAEMTFYITALIRGHRQGNKCLQEIVKASLTGTLLGCILFIPGVCMIIGGLRHREQRFNSRSAGVSSALLFISVGGVFAPTLFSKAYGNLICEDCTMSPNSTNSSGHFTCRRCHYDVGENNYSLFHSHIEPLVYTVSILLPAAYLIGLIFTLKTHSHIYDIHVGDGQAPGHLGTEVHWSRWRALLILVVGTVLMSACADLTTENIQPILSQPGVSQYFIGVTVLAMVPEIPEIVNGIQFALQNNISLSLEVGRCIAVQVCMIQIPLLIFFNAFYDVGFVLIFSDLHLWASIFSVILVNYIFMDGKSDYFQGTALVVVYFILLALYFFAPSPVEC